MFDWSETMKHKAMHDIFRKGQRNDATDEKHNVRTHSELRNRQQDDCEQGRYQHLAEIDDGGHAPIRGDELSNAVPTSSMLEPPSEDLQSRAEGKSKYATGFGLTTPAASEAAR
jgi:hypothetical protein